MRREAVFAAYGRNKNAAASVADLLLAMPESPLPSRTWSLKYALEHDGVTYPRRSDVTAKQVLMLFEAGKIHNLPPELKA